jgi:hypothetical protein
MTTPQDDPRIEAAAARTKQAAQERAAAYGPRWEPIWKRPPAPKTDQDKKKELREQRERLQAAAQRHFTAGQSRRPRPRRNRIGSAATRRDARALSRLRHSTARM